MDHRGFGKPPAEPVGTSAFALEKLLEDVDLLREELGFEQVVIIGHSGHSYASVDGEHFRLAMG